MATDPVFVLAVGDRLNLGMAVRQQRSFLTQTKLSCRDAFTGSEETTQDLKRQLALLHHKPEDAL